MIRLCWRSARYQVLFLRRQPGNLLPLVNIPLFTAAFLAITQHARRSDLAAYAVIGSGVIGIWSTSLYVSGEIIESERWLGTLEGIVATPAPLPIVVLGRIAAVTGISFIGLGESALVAWACFGVRITVYHPVLFACTLASAALAMIGTATVMSGLFVLARSVRTFQNSLSYPFYLLSGAVVPVALLPVWVRPLSRVVFLSWVSDLLRDSMRPGVAQRPGPRLGMVLALGAVGFAVGFWAINRILHRMRHLGVVGQT